MGLVPCPQRFPSETTNRYGVCPLQAIKMLGHIGSVHTYQQDPAEY